MPSQLPLSAVMRKIAGDALEKIFPYLPSDEEDALVTSIVRQWMTNDGHACVIKPEERHYLIFRRQESGYALDVQQVAGDMLQPFCRDWQIDLEQIPEIVEQLNICQSAAVTSRKGQALRFSVAPKEQTIRIEELQESP